MREYDPSSTTGSYGRGMESDPDDRGPEEIRVEIAQTRTEMSGTIDAIQQRLAPETLGQQAKDVARDATEQAKSAAQDVLQDAVREVKDAAKEVTAHAVHEVRDAARDVTTDAKDAAWDATIGRAENAVTSAGETAKGFGSIVIDTIKQNPIPAALAGLSLFWLYKHRAGSLGFASTSSLAPYSYQTPGSYRSQATPQAYPIRTGYASQAERDAMIADAARTGRPGSRSVSTTTTSQDEGDSGSMIGSAGQMANDAVSSASQMMGDVASSAGDLASGAASSAGQMASTAGETAADAGSSILDLIQRNPVPAALVGIGLGWLYMNRSSGQAGNTTFDASQYRYNSTSAPQAYRQGTSGSGGVSDMVGRATEQVGDLAGSAQERVGDLAGTVMDQTQRAPGQIQRMIQERPLTAAAVAASLGAAVGLWLPSTRIESQIMGATHDQVMDRAQEVASDTMEKVQAVAGETMEKVQDAAKEVRTTLKEESKSQGLTV
jgi:ElaB/YqjD/DUF883 family membrane-anchored ribosome-binding protein